MQRENETMFHDSLSRYFRTNGKNFYCHFLAHSVFLDTIFVSTVSRIGKKCAQVNATEFVWARAFPMASGREAHKAFSLLFARDGIPPACFCDNSKKMIQAKFTRCSMMLFVT